MHLVVLHAPAAALVSASPATAFVLPGLAQRARVTMAGFPEVDDDAYADANTKMLKDEIGAAHRAGDSNGLGKLVLKLEQLNPTERCATSPLLDGHWETLYASRPASWMRGGRVTHIIESYSSADSPGAPGLLAGPTGTRWDDVADGRGAYVQRARLRFGSTEGEDEGALNTPQNRLNASHLTGVCKPFARVRAVRGTYTWLGGEAWDIRYVSRARLIFGIPVWKQSVASPSAIVDFDHAVRPTFVDGDVCILRAPAVLAGECELRPERVYLLKRMRDRLWQDGSFIGLSDRPVFGFDLEP